MNTHLKQIIELSNYDKEIESFGPKIETIYEKLNQLVKMKDEKVEEMKEIDSKKASMKESIDKYQELLKVNSEKLIEISKKNTDVKNTKELSALQVEDDIARSNIENCNLEIAKLEETLNNIDANIGSLQVEITEDEELIKDFELSTQAQKEQLEAQRHKVFEKRSELLSKMEQNMITFYEKVKLWAKSTAVVPVKKQACYGCYMKLNDKVYAEVIKGEEIVTCHHCGRILYKEIEEEN